MAGRYVTPIDPALAALVEALNDDERSAYEEFAGVRQFMANEYTREQAEALAWQDLLAWRQQRQNCDASVLGGADPTT